jgi:hypothetical protein
MFNQEVPWNLTTKGAAALEPFRRRIGISAMPDRHGEYVLRCLRNLMA